jgi:hypothetical protein
MDELHNADSRLPRSVSKATSAIPIQIDRNGHNGTIHLHGGVPAGRRAGVIFQEGENLGDDVNWIAPSAVHVDWCFLEQQTLWGSDKRSSDSLFATLKVLSCLAADDDITRSIPDCRGVRPIILNVSEAADAS